MPAGLDLRSILELNRKWMKSVETPSVSAADVERFAQVIAALESRLGVNLQEFVAVFENRVRLLSRQSTSYARFFKLAKTKRLIVTDSYFSVALMAGARAAGVHIIELQHGFISRYHLGYSYPRGQASPYMADELWTFGQYWIDETPLPANIKTRVIGAPYVEALAAEPQRHREREPLARGMRPRAPRTAATGGLGIRHRDAHLGLARVQPFPHDAREDARVGLVRNGETFEHVRVEDDGGRIAAEAFAREGVDMEQAAFALGHGGAGSPGPGEDAH